ncbi:MAG: kinase/pyrophosphorylase [Rhodospirillaceae bacterium]|nr:kinase/pyrophosphorylase [Rhodospirillaceae bacterium]MBT5458179.1 kinase/pyrophosphorylase [Rhodospirillaceae bacterium]
MNSTFHLHLVSDSTGETTYSLARACLVQFENIEVNTQTHSQVLNAAKMQKVISAIEANPGAVMYTMIDKLLSKTLVKECSRIGVPCIDVLDGVISHLQRYFGQTIRGQPGRQHQLDEHYFDRIDAMQYALSHDDGQGYDHLDAAEIVLVGVSRTSKTPTSMYLANHRGIKAANVPFVPGVPLPDILFGDVAPYVVGLTTTPERLVQIRRQRMKMLGEGKETDYVELDRVREEIREARKLFAKMRWPVIDVTRRSIEETASEIIELYSAHHELDIAAPHGAPLSKTPAS